VSYHVHYNGFNSRHDKWVSPTLVFETGVDKVPRSERGGAYIGAVYMPSPASA
jgi:hypothetical protein